MDTEIVEKLRPILSKASISEAEASYTLSMLRKLMEHMNAADTAKFPVLKSYTNWISHIAIDREPVAIELLHNIHERMGTLMHIPDNDRLIREFSDLLSLKDLREQMKNIFSIVGLPDKITTDDVRWKEFREHLVSIIRDCPIRFPARKDMSSKTKKLYDAVMSNPLKSGMAITQVSITYIDQNVFRNKPAFSGEYYVCMEMLTTDGVKIIVPMSL